MHILTYPRAAAQVTTQLSSSRQAAYEAELAGFHQFAALKGCSLDQPFYDTIQTKLQAFSQEGISDELINRGFQACGDTLMVEIVNGTLYMKLKDGATQEGKDRLEWFQYFFKVILRWLPDTKFVINLMDEPCSWTAPIPPAAQAALRDGSLGFKDAWLKYGCDSVGMAKMKKLHGLFVSPETYPFTREKVPVWSLYSVPGCFADLLGPNFGVTGTITKCPPYGEKIKPFKDKVKKAIFRGASTGGGIFPGQGAEVYSKFHRFRLLEHAKSLHRSDIDVGITRYVQCRPKETCKEMERRYGKADEVKEIEILNHAYHILVDGNSGLNRMPRYLCSGSVTLLGCITEEWYTKGLRPFKEYLPLNIDYSNLASLVDWAQSHPAEAEEISSNAAKFAEKHLRLEELQCYTYRQIVEYNKLRV